MHNRFAAKGLKKLFSLAKTKIRLAREANTIAVKPTPLQLVKKLSGESVTTVDEAEKHALRLNTEADYSNAESIASTVFQLMDVVEGVKYNFEPHEAFALITAGELRGIEANLRDAGEKLNFLLMSNQILSGVNFYVGFKPPEKALHYSLTPTSIATFLDYAFKSSYLSDGMRLQNIRTALGSKTLIMNAVHYSLIAYGAEEGCVLP